ncbi:acetylornithine deacetylase [Granulosicoccaceae sp. 1_MG-2023]|nr:acetylornithine deacetylase [Granulosicoccaceae sp. 1_MG-2023]
MTLPHLTEMMQTLVSIPSISSVNPDFDMSNEAVINQLAEWAEMAGFRCDIHAVAAKPGHFNLVARKGAGQGGLVLSGHTDTVPCDERLWSSDPFTLTLRENRLHGLGSTDMKSFIAMAIKAAEGFAADDLQRAVTLLATADEESGMFGAKALMESGEDFGRFAVIGEPTNLQPVRMHKGIFMEGVRIRGRSGHSSDPALGHNAMEAMHTVIGEILSFRKELQARYRNDAFAVPYPTLNLGHIHGGDNPNRICGACELSVDLRPLPGMDVAETREALRDRIRASLGEDSVFGLEFEMLFEGIPAVETQAGSAIVQAAEKLSGHEAQAVAFGTEAPYLKALGMDVVVMGPGDIRTAHQPDEYIPVAQIDRTVQILQDLIRRFCLDTGPAD